MKEKRYQTYPNRWGTGRVHRYLYDSLNRSWYLACQEVSRGTPYGHEVSRDREVTCKKCYPPI